jgi:hypothetical protein
MYGDEVQQLSVPTRVYHYTPITGSECVQPIGGHAANEICRNGVRSNFGCRNQKSEAVLCSGDWDRRLANDCFNGFRLVAGGCVSSR